MMHNQQHPDTEMLDRLRAGLLDDQPAQKTALEKHLSECDTCRVHAGIWQQLESGALGPHLDTGNLGTALYTARRQALAGTNSRQAWAMTPYATAAAVLLAVSIGLWTTQPGIDTNSQMTADTSQSVPDIYEDLDFYLWLATQNDSDIDQSNPNST